MSEEKSNPLSFAALTAFIKARDGDLEVKKMARKLRVSNQTLGNWRKRGISKDGALAAQDIYGVDSKALFKDGVARPVSSSGATHAYSSVPPLRWVQIRGNAIVDKEGFWLEMTESASDERFEINSSDPDAYAIRIVGRRYAPSIETGSCVLVEPNSPLRVTRKALIVLKDGRHAIRNYLNHADGLWIFTSLIDSNDALELMDDEVEHVYRITTVFDGD